MVKSSALLASSGVIVSTVLTGGAAMLLFNDEFESIATYNTQCEQHPTNMALQHRRLAGGAGAGELYDCSHDKWFAALMFGAIVSATDPVAVVAVLQTLGAQPKLSHMIEGESLLNDGSAVVIFMLFKGLLEHGIQGANSHVAMGNIVLLVLRLAGAAVVLGEVFAFIVYQWLRISRNLKSQTQISITVLCVYAVFYISEHWFGASGVLATVVYGLSLAKRRHLAMKVETTEQNEVVWEEIGYIANSFTFALAGVILFRIIGEDLASSKHGRASFSRSTHFGYAIALYFILAAIRLVTIYINYPLMKWVTSEGYKVRPKEVLFMTYSGLRGAVSLCVALFVEHMHLPPAVKDVVIFHTCMVVFLTVFVNGISAGGVYKLLGLGQQGRVRGTIDYHTVEKINTRLEKFLFGKRTGTNAASAPLVALKDHWLHGFHNTSSGKIEGLKTVQKLLLLTMNETAHEEKRPLSSTGQLQLETVNVRKIWDEDCMSVAAPLWRKWVVRRAKRSDFNKEDIQHIQLVHYSNIVPIHHREHAGGDSSLKKWALVKHMTDAMTELTPLLPFAGNGSFFEQARERPVSKGHQRIDLYSIYLTSLHAHFDEELEEARVTAAAHSYLVRAITVGLDRLKILDMVPEPDWTHDENKVILCMHHAVCEFVEEFELDGSWSSPPTHYVAVMTEVFVAMFEAIEAVNEYLHTHLVLPLDCGCDNIIGDVRAECTQVAELTLESLAARNFQQHPLMAPAHTFLAFREAYFYARKQLDESKAHGLMSHACHDLLTEQLESRFQDFLSVFETGLMQGLLLGVREAWFARCCKACGGRTPAQLATHSLGTPLSCTTNISRVWRQWRPAALLRMLVL